jgi:hypothetical protein
MNDSDMVRAQSAVASLPVIEPFNGRPGFQSQPSGAPAYSYRDGLRAIRNAVGMRPGLAHGTAMDRSGTMCAVGSCFSDSKLGLPSDLVREVTAYNDSMPHVSERTRRNRVLRWLNWRLFKTWLYR